MARHARQRDGDATIYRALVAEKRAREAGEPANGEPATFSGSVAVAVRAATEAEAETILAEWLAHAADEAGDSGVILDTETPASLRADD
jgi:hypothetical protein